MSTTPSPIPSRPLPWPAIALLPHRPPLLLVERLTEREESRSQAEAVLSDTGLFLEPGGVAPEFFVELVAQTAALGHGYDRAMAGLPPGGGMIVGVDGFTWPVAAVFSGRLHIRTEVVMVFAAMKVVRGEVYQGKTLVAAGEVRVWEDEAMSLPAAPSGEMAPQAVSEATPQGPLGPAIRSCCRHWQEEQVPDGRRGRGQYCFPLDFPGFVGHFPGNPLLPAVLQLAAARHGVARLLARSLVPMSLEKTKFKGMIRPGDEVVLTLDLKERGDETRAAFSWKRPDGAAISSGTIHFS